MMFVFIIAMALSVCLMKYHLILLAAIVGISMVLIVIGGSLSAWCVREGDVWICHSLFHSDRTFSCLFKLLPATTLFCLSISLMMFIIQVTFHFCRPYSDLTRKEYRNVLRFINVFALSVSVVLIMIILLYWFHWPSSTSNPILMAIRSQKSDNSVSIDYRLIGPSDPEYLPAITAQRQAIGSPEPQWNHGPNLFVASFILLFIVLLAYVSAFRLDA
jgi:hypothetical protein